MRPFSLLRIPSGPTMFVLKLMWFYCTVNDYCAIFQVCFAYKSCTGEEMDSKWLRQRRKSQDDFDYEEFCAIVTEYKAQV